METSEEAPDQDPDVSRHALRTTRYASCIDKVFLHGGLCPDGSLRAIASIAVFFAENAENVDNVENGSPSHRKSTMTSCHKTSASLGS